MSRLAGQPGERIDRDKMIRFTFDGKPVEAFEGDTIGSALYAAGQRTFSRSFKYHRRRGLMCCAGQCPNCLVAVDGAPGARACIEPVREGIRVEHLNARPGARARRDARHRHGRRPVHAARLLLQDVHPAPQAVAGLREGPAPRRRPRRAAQGAARARVAHRVPPPPRRRARRSAAGSPASPPRSAPRLADEGAGRRARRRGPEPDRARSAGVEILDPGLRARLLRRHGPGLAGRHAAPDPRRAHVFATGTIEQPLVFAGNDLPGVMLSGGRAALAALYAVSPGTRAVLATTSDRGLEAAAALRDAGVQIVAVADLRETRPSAGASGCAERGIEVLDGHTIVEARGRSRRARPRSSPRSASRAPGSGRSTATSSSSPAGSRRRPRCCSRPARGRATTPTRGCFASPRSRRRFAAGEVAGSEEPRRRRARAAGRPARGGCRSRGRARCGATATGRRRSRSRRRSPAPAAASASPASARTSPRKDIKLSVEEGYDSIELSKRYTTVTMGPCQGRMCQLAGDPADGQGDRAEPRDVGMTTARPPWVSVPMGVLAGRPFEPAKRSSIHARHRELGANVKWAGDWRRPYDYGDPEGEALARPPGRRADRRLDARQAARARPRRRRVPRPPVPQPLLRPQAGPDPLRRDQLRRRPDRRRRHDLPARRGHASTSRPPRAAPARSRSGSRGGWPTGAWRCT